MRDIEGCLGMRSTSLSTVSTNGGGNVTTVTASTTFIYTASSTPGNSTECFWLQRIKSPALQKLTECIREDD